MITDDGDMGAIKVQGGHVYMKRMSEVDDAGTMKVQYKMFRKKDDDGDRA